MSPISIPCMWRPLDNGTLICNKSRYVAYRSDVWIHKYKKNHLTLSTILAFILENLIVGRLVINSSAMNYKYAGKIGQCQYTVCTLRSCTILVTPTKRGLVFLWIQDNVSVVVDMRYTSHMISNRNYGRNWDMLFWSTKVKICETSYTL